MGAIPEFVRAMPQDGDALLRALSAQIDDTMLEEIASADYGQDIERHFEPLKALRDTGRFPDTWGAMHPMECVELIRWSQPEEPEGRPRGWNVRDHWKRAFSSLCVMRYFAENGQAEPGGGVAASIAPLVESLSILDPGLDKPFAEFLIWLLHRLDPSERTEELPGIVGGLLFTALRSADQTTVGLASWLIGACEQSGDARWDHKSEWRAIAAELERQDFWSLPESVQDVVINAIVALKGPPDQATLPDDPL